MDDIFWADQIAGECIERAAREKNVVTCRGGGSPSGTKHIGNLFDATKAYIVYKAVRARRDARMIFTHDDRDPLRTVPARLATLDAKWVTVDDILEKEISAYLGYPYISIPDPFECCESWAEHFSTIWANGVFALGLGDTQFFSTDTLYEEGKFEPYIVMALQNIDAVRKLIQQFQRTKTADYIPFDAICDNCGRIIGQPISFDIESKTVKYVCMGKSLAGKYTIEGCGHSGETTFGGGKLPWTFEWPAQWGMFNTTFEPFGKEHAEGSWPRGQVIAREIFGFEPPIPHIYEFLLIDGEKMSSRRGNVYITQEILEIIEPEVFMYFYTKRSKKQRNLDIKNIHILVEDFEKAERVYFNAEEVSEKERINYIRMYETSVQQLPKAPPLRIPYQLAAVISEFNPYDSKERALELLKSTGHISGKVSKEDEERIMMRLQLAKKWSERFAQDMRIRVNDDVSPEVKKSLTSAQKDALRELAQQLKKQLTHEELYSKLYEISKNHNLDSKDFFKAAYNVLVSRDSGPRLAAFIFTLGQDRTRKILEQV